MQAVQPEVKAIQDRYAKYKLTDPERQKMNQEMMALYKQKWRQSGERLRADAADVTDPVRVLRDAQSGHRTARRAVLRLDHGPVATRSRCIITPVLMGATMFWQQKMMPTTADPIQQRIFLLMPVIFTVSFLWAPAGLVVYWFASNLLAIGQQYLTNRMIGAPLPRPAAAKAKSVGRAGRRD